MKVKLKEGAYEVLHAHSDDAGYDLRTPVDCIVPANGSATIDTGVCMAIPNGYGGLLISKSGLNVKFGLTGTGLIDSGYTDSIVVKLYNDTPNNYEFKAGDKVIQIVLIKIATPDIEYVSELDETDRGSDGFGSSGC